VPKRKVRPTPIPGTIYERDYKGTTYKLVVVESPNGIRYTLGNRTFETLTAAAKSLVGAEQSISGPRFWGLDKPSGRFS
jgi:hypothetical protein